MDADELARRVEERLESLAATQAEIARDVLRWVVAAVDSLAPEVAYIGFVLRWETPGLDVTGFYDSSGAPLEPSDALDELHDSLLGDGIFEHLDKAPHQVLGRFAARVGPGSPRRLDLADIRADLCE